jgi:hypothetical protein
LGAKIIINLTKQQPFPLGTRSKQSHFNINKDDLWMEIETQQSASLQLSSFSSAGD